MTQAQQAQFEDHFARGDYALAASRAAKQEGKGAGGSSQLLWKLQQGAALQAAGDMEESIELFDTTEAFFSHFDQDNRLMRWSEQLAALFSNDSALAYRGTLYDAIMVNSYKALGFMTLGEMGNARVELNRARDRQRRAVIRYSDRIREEREALREEAPAGTDMDSTLSRAEQRLESEYRRLEPWSVYPAFVNPLATWLEGLYLLTVGEARGDSSSAVQALERAVGMVPENPQLKRDLQWAIDLADGRRRREDLPATVWVLFENGLGPVKEEQRIEIPVVFSVSDRPAIFTGLAYPVLRYRNGIPGGLRVGESGQTAELLSNMDAVISTEFRERLPAVIARAVAASVARATLQYQLQRQWGDLAGFVGLLYQIYATQADTRIWSALPKRFDMTAVEKPDDNRLRLSWAGQNPEVVLPEGQFHLVWVRAPSAGADPGIRVITLE
ncbi:MAG: hypothetical protein R3296_05785 [Oleiphilaceae bacterium]|nr:hypothetical protein [Oleiphilaceae bacterium]